MKFLVVLMLGALVTACNGHYAGGLSRGLNGYQPAPQVCKTYQVGYMWKTVCY